MFLELIGMDFVRYALISSALTGLICSYLGIFVILRRIVFVGIALAQMSALGVAAAVYFDKDPTFFAILFTIIGVALMAPDYGKKRFPPEAVMGIGFTASWAFGILILSKAAHGEADMLNLVRGNILGASQKDIMTLVYVIVPVFIIHLLFYKRFLFVSFDSEMAGTLGIKTNLWDLIFFITLGVVVAVSIKVAGVLLTFAMLLLPAVTALTLGGGMKTNFILAGAAALISSVAGVFFSIKMDLPTGPAIVATAFIIFTAVYGGRFIYDKIIHFTGRKKTTAS